MAYDRGAGVLIAGILLVALIVIGLVFFSVETLRAART
jgi:hypothetical protein